ncbi:hypothetical protein AgCh_017215 [Apium graveolens]
MANRRLIMVLKTGLKSKKLKTSEDEAMIKILRRYIDNPEANFPKTQINKDELGEDEQKKDGQNPSGSNSSQSSKAIGPKEAKVKRRFRRQRRQLIAEFLNDHGFGEKAIWNIYNQDDFKPLNFVDSDEDYFQQLAKRMVRVLVVNIKEVRIYYSDGSFEQLGNRLMDSLSIVELKRVLSLMNGKDTATKAWRTVLAVFVVNREEMRDEHRALLAEKRRKYEHDIDEYIRRSEELKVAGKSRISKDGRFLNVKAGSLSRYRINAQSTQGTDVEQQSVVSQEHFDVSKAIDLPASLIAQQSIHKESSISESPQHVIGTKVLEVNLEAPIHLSKILEDVQITAEVQNLAAIEESNDGKETHLSNAMLDLANELFFPEDMPMHKEVGVEADQYLQTLEEKLIEAEIIQVGLRRKISGSILSLGSEVNL